MCLSESSLDSVRRSHAETLAVSETPSATRTSSVSESDGAWPSLFREGLPLTFASSQTPSAGLEPSRITVLELAFNDMRLSGSVSLSHQHLRCASSALADTLSAVSCLEATTYHRACH